MISESLAMDILLAFGLVVGLVIGARRRTVTQFFVLIGVIFAIIVASGLYRLMGDTLIQGLGEIGFPITWRSAYPFSFLVLTLLAYGIAEAVIRAYMPGGAIRSLWVLDNLIGAGLGAVWAALWLGVLVGTFQYVLAYQGSSLLPFIARLFRLLVLFVLRFFYPQGLPPIFDPLV